MQYNWQLKDWPNFCFNLTDLEGKLLDFAQQTGKMGGMLQSLSAEAQTDIAINIMLAEALKTSEIEGEYFSREDVMSSIRNNLGLNPIPEKVADKRAAGVGEMMVDVRKSFAEPLTNTKLFEWHQMLMKGHRHINPGAWRTDEAPMQIISGPVGKEKVHFEAPPSSKVPEEMERFIRWFNSSAPNGTNSIVHAPIRAAIAHLYFESIHPFEDGNGRIGRAIAEKALSQTIGRPVVLSISQAIEQDRKKYYAALQENSLTNAIDSWLGYFVDLVQNAQAYAEGQVVFVLKKTQFFDKYASTLNPRQMKALKAMLEYGPAGFMGGMNARKYIGITKASKATATRDLQDLTELGALAVVGGGRSTRYEVNL